MSFDTRFKNFPKSRPPLTPAHKKVYEAEYKLNREGKSPIEWLGKKLEAWMHHQVSSRQGSATLELGAGNLNHLAFEDVINTYDVVEPFKELFYSSDKTAEIDKFYESLKDIPARNQYDRIISCAVLEHMTDLPREVARSGLLLSKGGIFQAGIPSEGGMLWGLAWRCTTAISYWLRNKISYKTVMEHEHVNNADEIINIVKYFFEDVKIKRFPLPTHHASLFCYIEACNPDIERCKEILVREE